MPQHSNLVRYMGQNYALEDVYDDSCSVSLSETIPQLYLSNNHRPGPDMFENSYRVSLFKDTSQPALYSISNTMAFQGNANTCLVQAMMNQDTDLFTGDMFQYNKHT